MEFTLNNIFKNTPYSSALQYNRLIQRTQLEIKVIYIAIAILFLLTCSLLYAWWRQRSVRSIDNPPEEYPHLNNLTHLNAKVDLSVSELSKQETTVSIQDDLAEKQSAVISEVEKKASAIPTIAPNSSEYPSQKELAPTEIVQEKGENPCGETKHARLDEGSLSNDRTPIMGHNIANLIEQVSFFFEKYDFSNEKKMKFQEFIANLIATDMLPRGTEEGYSVAQEKIIKNDITQKFDLIFGKCLENENRGIPSFKSLIHACTNFDPGNLCPTFYKHAMMDCESIFCDVLVDPTNLESALQSKIKLFVSETIDAKAKELCKDRHWTFQMMGALFPDTFLAEDISPRDLQIGKQMSAHETMAVRKLIEQRYQDFLKDLILWCSATSPITLPNFNLIVQKFQEIGEDPYSSVSADFTQFKPDALHRLISRMFPTLAEVYKL